MKTKLFAVVILCLLFSSISSAQTKVGTIDSELILGVMPETKKVMLLLSRYANRLDSTYQIKFKDYQDKVAAYKKGEKDFADNYKQIKIKEIGDMEKELQKNQSNANKLIQLKRDELMRPLYKKLKGVIEEMAKAEGYTQIITTTNTEFGYIDMKHDFTKRVLKKLGIELKQE